MDSAPRDRAAESKSGPGGEPPPGRIRQLRRVRRAPSRRPTPASCVGSVLSWGVDLASFAHDRIGGGAEPLRTSP